MLRKRSSMILAVYLKPSERVFIKTLLRRYQDSLDILREPHYNELSRRCDAILRQVR